MILPQRDDAGKQPEPGTLGEQLAAIGISLVLVDDRGTTAAMEWNKASQVAKDSKLTLPEKPVEDREIGQAQVTSEQAITRCINASQTEEGT
ncbi:hypothetical protein N9B79_01385 [bacterium]|nr:hypothetical protein [bacterium]